jgi:hypothetical protein
VFLLGWLRLLMLRSSAVDWCSLVSHPDLGPSAELENAVQAMVLKKLGAALEWTDLADRQPGPAEIRVKVAAWVGNGSQNSQANVRWVDL